MFASPHRHLVMALAFVTASAAFARAQSNGQVPVVVEHVEVVATRVPESSGEAPVSVEVINGDEIRLRGATIGNIHR